MKNDFSKFIDSLQENPLQGVDLGEGLRKIRMAIESKGKGKSKGVRVITYATLVDKETGDIYLLEIYDKSDASNIKMNVIKSMLEELNL